jgi:hypothetical protein
MSATLQFTNGYSVYFRSISSTHKFIDRFPDVQNAVMAVFMNGRWEGRFVFIHSQFVSDGTTIIVTGAENAEIKLDGQMASSGDLDLASGAAGLEVTSEQNVAARAICKAGWAPLFSLSKIMPRNRLLALLGLGNEVVEPLLTAFQDEDADQVRIPGDVLSRMEPEVFIDVARRFGTKVDDFYQVTELY